MEHLFLQTALECAEIAAQISLASFRKSFSINRKIGNYPVTAVDLNIEKTIRTIIQKNYPDHAIIGEEFGNTSKSSKYTWVIDPIDGTAAYTMGKPTYTTLIALLEKQVPLLGVIDQPFMRERYIGIKNEGAWHNAQILHSSECENLADARLSATTPYMFISDYEQKVLNLVQKQVKVKSFGGDAYSYALLASGNIDIILEADLKFYDVASLIPIIEQSGGVITDWHGNNLAQNFKGQCLATANSILHEKILNLIKKV